MRAEVLTKNHCLPEDDPSVSYCLSCSRCPIPKQGDIYNDGKWFCFGFHEWRLGADIFEQFCPHYVMRGCWTCIHHKKCDERIRKDREEGKVYNFCERYKAHRFRSRWYCGRVGFIRSTDPIVLRNEQAYLDWKRKQHEETVQGYGDEGLSTYDSDRDERSGTLPIDEEG